MRFYDFMVRIHLFSSLFRRHDVVTRTKQIEKYQIEKYVDFVLTEKVKTKSNLLLFGQTRTCFFIHFEQGYIIKKEMKMSKSSKLRKDVHILVHSSVCIFVIVVQQI